LGRKKVHDYVYVVVIEATSEAKGHGFFEDEVVDVGDGQVQNTQQSFG
jgi:hypothetical protein